MTNETEDKLEAEMYQAWLVANQMCKNITADPFAYKNFIADLEDMSCFIAEALTAIKNTESLNVSLVGM